MTFSRRAVLLAGWIGITACSLGVDGGVAWSQSGDGRAFQVAEPFLPRAGTNQKGPFAWPEQLKEEIVQRLNAGAAPLMLTTTTIHGVYSITLRFDAERPADEVRRVIQSILAAHPSSAGLAVTEVDAGRLPTLSIALTSRALPGLQVSDYAAQHIQPRLARLLDGVGQVRLCRDMSVALMVHLDPSVWQRMATTGIDMHSVLGPAIAKLGDETGHAGITRKGDSYAIVLAPGSMHTLDGPSLGNRQIALPDGRQIQLRDIARVELGMRPTFDFCLYKGERAVILLVDLRWHEALATTLTRLDQEVQAISRDLPALVSLTVVPNQTTRSR